MPKTTFTLGTIVTAEFLNAVNNPVFVDPADNDGEIPLLTDAALSNAPGNVKPEWQTFRDALKVQAGQANSVFWNAGAISGSNGEIAVIAAGSLSMPISGTFYVYVSPALAVAQSATIPARALLLAKVTLASAAVTNVIDMRPRFAITPIGGAIKTLGGSGEEGPITIAADLTLDKGEYFFSEFTLNSGVTLTIPRYAKIHVSGNVNIAGTINVTGALQGAPGFATNVVGTIGGAAGYGPGAGSAGPGDVYNSALSPVGSSGAQGLISLNASSSGIVPSGGMAGGGVEFDSGGTITVSGTIIANGGNGTAGIITLGTGIISGAGGGSGGRISLRALQSVTLTASSSLSVRGGNGGSGVGTGAEGGGAGGGGRIDLTAPVVSSGSGTITLNAGADGTSLGTSIGGGGGAGYGGRGGVRNSSPQSAQPGVLTTRNFAPVA